MRIFPKKETFHQSLDYIRTCQTLIVPHFLIEKNVLMEIFSKKETFHQSVDYMSNFWLYLISLLRKMYSWEFFPKKETFHQSVHRLHIKLLIVPDFFIEKNALMGTFSHSFLSIPSEFLRNSGILSGFRGFREESVGDWKVLHLESMGHQFLVDSMWTPCELQLFN